MRNLKSGLFFLILSTLLAYINADASVAVYPQVLFINAPNRSVAITVSNPTELRQEIWVDFRYGYPLVDDTGKFYIKYFEGETAQEVCHREGEQGEGKGAGGRSATCPRRRA